MINITQDLRREQSATTVGHPNILSLPWLTFVFGILPLSLVAGLLLYAWKSGWASGIVFGLSWLVQIAIFMGLIYWVIREEYFSGRLDSQGGDDVEHRA